MTKPKQSAPAMMEARQMAAERKPISREISV